MIDSDMLLRFNPWWEAGEISKELAKPFKRDLFYKLLNYVEDRQIIEITGLRRVGKTTILYQLIDHLLKTVPKEKIFYFSFDEKSASIRELIKVYETEILTKKIEDSGRIYIFLDEIQKCKNWDSELKIFYDLYPNLKFFISGSASLLLDKKAKESLAGRVFSFHLTPLTFQEFLKFKGIKIEEEKLHLQERTLSTQFFDYLKKGGFIEISLEKSDEKIREYVKNNIIERIVYKDVPEAFGIKDLELLKTLVELFCRNSGMVLNLDSLAKDLKRSRITIANYIYYLQFSLLIKMIRNLRKGFLVTSRKLKKVYVTSTSFIFAFENLKGNLSKFLETFVCNSLGLDYYYRDRFEIDFIAKNKRVLPIEVKSSVKEREVETFQKNIKKLGLKKGLIVSKDQRVKTKNVEVMPAYFILNREILKRYFEF